MTEAIEELQHKDQWTILYGHAIEELQSKIAPLKAEYERLEIELTRAAAESILITPRIPKAIEPLQPVSERMTLPDGTGTISTANLPETKPLLRESDKMLELRSGLELAKAKKLYAEKSVRDLQKIGSADAATKQAWIQKQVDQFFQKVLGEYTDYLAQKAEDHARRKDPTAKVHKPPLSNNAFPSLLALQLFPDLCSAANRDQVVAAFIEENRADLTIAKHKVAEMMIHQARQLGLLPNSPEEVDQQDRKLTTVLQRLNP